MMHAVIPILCPEMHVIIARITYMCYYSECRMMYMYIVLLYVTSKFGQTDYYLNHLKYQTDQCPYCAMNTQFHITYGECCMMYMYIWTN